MTWDRGSRSEFFLFTKGFKEEEIKVSLVISSSGTILSVRLCRKSGWIA